MITLVAILAVALFGYLFRAAPLVLLGHVQLTPRVERLVRHAGAGALTALLVGALRHGAAGTSTVAVLAATAVALVVAARGDALLRVVVAGGAVYVAFVLVGV